jgi:hypothetical protein
VIVTILGEGGDNAPINEYRRLSVCLSVVSGLGWSVPVFVHNSVML